MNWQLAMQIMMLLASYDQMKKDGLDKTEKMILLNQFLNMLSITLNAGEIITFEEMDKDLHIIIKESLRNKLGI
jgi:hypothetical protein